MPPKARKGVKESKTAKKVLHFGGGKIKPKLTLRTPSPEPPAALLDTKELTAWTPNSTSKYGLDLSGVTHKQPSDDILRITWPKKTFFDLREYSSKGVMLGTKNSTIYVKVDGKYNEDPQPYDLQSTLAAIDEYATEAFAVAQSSLEGMWGILPKPKFTGGLKDMKAIDLKSGKISYCLFPHQTYTTVYEYNSITGADPIKKNIQHLFSNSGNSEFIFRLSVSCVEFAYTNEGLTVQPYVNVTTMTWIQAGQNTQVSTELEEEDRVARQISNIKEVLGSSGSRVLPIVSKSTE
jgi:hypothetical protein